MSAARYALGVDLGTTYTCAAVAADGAPRIAQLTGTSHTIPSVVSRTEAGFMAGEAAERRIISHPASTAREFKRRFGDPAPIVLDGQTFGADALTAALLREVVQRVETAEGAPPSAVALAHPASWGPFRLDLLRSAATQAGISDVRLVPEPVAAAVANSDRVAADSLVAVYDLGGGTFDAAVVRCADDWPVVGTPEGVERLGGIDFDQAILAHVDQALDGQVFTLDTADPDARSALMRLRAECQRAKEHLSQDTDVEIPVVLPNLQTAVRLTRSEFETMVRPRLADSLTVLDRVVASAGVEWSDISAVLLVGGSSNIPAVGQLVSEHTGRPVISATNPHLAIALGTAAIAQRDVVRAATPSPVPASSPTSTSSSDADDSGSGSTPASVPAPERRRPVGLIVAAAVAIVAAIGAFVAFTGGDDTESATPGSVDTTSAVVVETSPVDVGSTPVETDVTQTASTDSPATTSAASPPTSDVVTAPSNEIATVDVCATDIGDVQRFAGSAEGLFLLSPTGLSVLGAEGLAACSLDISTAVAADVGQPSDLTDVTSFDTVLAFSAPGGGSVLNQSTGTIVACPALTGTAGVNDDGILLVITGDVVERYQLDRNTGCTLTDASTEDEISANGLAIGGRNRFAVIGSERTTGAPRLLLANGPGDFIPVDGFARLDGVVRCGDLWCAFDADASVIHVVSIDGVVLGDVPLGAELPAAVSEVLDLTSTRADGAFALVRLADGSTPVLRITT